jgi:hypothetical protein
MQIKNKAHSTKAIIIRCLILVISSNCFLFILLENSTPQSVECPSNAIPDDVVEFRVQAELKTKFVPGKKVLLVDYKQKEIFTAILQEKEIDQMGLSQLPNHEYFIVLINKDDISKLNRAKKIFIFPDNSLNLESLKTQRRSKTYEIHY